MSKLWKMTWYFRNNYCVPQYRCFSCHRSVMRPRPQPPPQFLFPILSPNITARTLRNSLILRDRRAFSTCRSLVCLRQHPSPFLSRRLCYPFVFPRPSRRQITTTSSTSYANSEPAPLTIEEYHALSDSYIEGLLVQLEELQEEREDVDVEFSVGSLLSFNPPPFLLSYYRYSSQVSLRPARRSEACP